MAESGCLRDVAVQNLDVGGKADLSSATLTYKVAVESITTATYTVAAIQSGSLFVLNKADGIVVTLPAPASGLSFNFVVGIAPTATATIAVAQLGPPTP